MDEKRLRLAQAGIDFAPADLSNHFLLTRDGWVCLVERTKSTPPDLGAIGSVCKLSPDGFAVVVWEAEQAYFVTKGSRQAASPEEVESCRRFAKDVREAIGE